MPPETTSSSKSPLVSIITVTFNAELYLEETIQSVLKQDYPEIEYLIIDGQSQDETLAIIQRYEREIDYWQSEPDQGIYEAMNKGLDLAKGEYVWFMNAGDMIYRSDTLRQVMENAREADVYYGEAEYQDLLGSPLGLRSEVMPHPLPSQMTWRDFKKGMVVCHQAFIARREICPQYRLRHAYSGDIDWCVRVLKKAKQVQHTGLVLCSYRQGGFSRRYLWRSWWDRAKILAHHFGFWPTLFRHLQIIVRAAYFVVFRRKKY